MSNAEEKACRAWGNPVNSMEVEELDLYRASVRVRDSANPRHALPL